MPNRNFPNVEFSQAFECDKSTHFTSKSYQNVLQCFNIYILVNFTINSKRKVNKYYLF